MRSAKGVVTSTCTIGAHHANLYAIVILSEMISPSLTLDCLVGPAEVELVVSRPTNPSDICATGIVTIVFIQSFSHPLTFAIGGSSKFLRTQNRGPINVSLVEHHGTTA